MENYGYQDREHWPDECLKDRLLDLEWLHDNPPEDANQPDWILESYREEIAVISDELNTRLQRRANK